MSEKDQLTNEVAVCASFPLNCSTAREVAISDYEYSQIIELQNLACERVLREWADANGFANRTMIELINAFINADKEHNEVAVSASFPLNCSTARAENAEREPPNFREIDCCDNCKHRKEIGSSLVCVKFNRPTYPTWICECYE